MMRTSGDVTTYVDGVAADTQTVADADGAGEQ